jgi:tetratricopeptide (TPR) repeat protein
MSSIAHYCQKCLAGNPLGTEFCARCGTRLMIVVEPAAARYETGESGAANEEHLLERISALENRIARLSEKLERGLDLLLRQAQNSHFDRALVKSLVGLLTDDGIIQGSRLERLWIESCQKEAAQHEESERRDDLRVKILAAYRGDDREAFEDSITQGFLFIEEDQAVRGIRSLRQAARMSIDNAPLLCFIGEHFFRAGKPRHARTYLERAYEILPRDRRVALLLGLTCADEGDTERAKELLGRAMRLGASSFAAHYGLGRLFVAEENWRKALQEFKLALASKASPEAHYALGCLYYQLCRDSLAAHHLRKALELDQAYAEASYVLSLISQRAGHKKGGEEHFVKPPPRTAANRHANRGRQQKGRQVVAPLFRSSRGDSRRLITGGDRRLAEALRQDALSAANSVDVDG